MLEDGLQNSERPAEALPHERVGSGWSLGEGERPVFVLHAIAVAQQSHGEIGVFGYGIHVVTAGFANGRYAPGSNGARAPAYRAPGVERAPLEILAGAVFEGLPAGPALS